MKFLIACPVYKREHPVHEAAVDATLRAFGGAASYRAHRWDSSLVRARSALFGEFLQGDYTHLLQTDDDQSWGAGHLKTLLDLDLPVVGLPCALKFDPPHPCAGLSTVRGLPGETLDARGVVRVQYLGGGFILWRRDVLLTLCLAHPELEFFTNFGGQERVRTFAFWTEGVRDGELLTEDYTACRYATDAGFPIHCWLGACSPHWIGDRDDRTDAKGTWKAYVPTGYDPVVKQAA